MSELGNRAGWSFPYVGNRPRDILGLTMEQEAAISQFAGFFGMDQDGNEQKLFLLKYDGTEVPTLTDYASTPVGTILLCPKVEGISHYIHQAKSDTAVVGDWKAVTAATVT